MKILRQKLAMYQAGVVNLYSSHPPPSHPTPYTLLKWDTYAEKEVPGILA
jgi:hypothetical protein